MPHCRLPCADVCCIHGSDCGTQLCSAIKGLISVKRIAYVCFSVPPFSPLLPEVHLSHKSTVHNHIFKQGSGTKSPTHQSFRSLLQKHCNTCIPYECGTTLESMLLFGTSVPCWEARTLWQRLATKWHVDVGSPFPPDNGGQLLRPERTA